MRDDALGTFTTTYNVGSVVKGATILTGYQTGVIRPGAHFYDSPLHIAGTPPKKSWKSFGSINDVNALKVSSNVYMFHTAIKIGGGRYIPNGSLPLKKEGFDIMRQHFVSSVLECGRELICRMNRRVRKGQVQHPVCYLTLRLVSMIRILPCNWHNMFLPLPMVATGWSRIWSRKFVSRKWIMNSVRL